MPTRKRTFSDVSIKEDNLPKKNKLDINFDVYLNDIQGLERLVTLIEDHEDKKEVVSQFLSGGHEKQLMQFYDNQCKTIEVRVLARLTSYILRLTADELSDQFGEAGMEIANDLIVFHLPMVTRCLSYGNTSSYIKDGLQLLMAIASQGFPAARDLAVGVDWTSKMMSALVERRDTRAENDVRSSLIECVTALLITGGAVVLRSFLDRNRFLNSLMQGLVIDKFSTLKIFVERLTWVAHNPAISKTQRCRLFDREGLVALLKTYNWQGPKKSLKEERGDMSELLDDPVLCAERSEVRKMVHELLLQLVTSPQLGVVFTDAQIGAGDKRKNNTLLSLLRELENRGMADEESRELILSIVKACPDLLCPYLEHVAPTLLARHSQRWFNRMQLVTQMIEEVTGAEGILTAAKNALDYHHLSQALANWAFLPATAVEEIAGGLQLETSVKKAVSRLFRSTANRIRLALIWLATVDFEEKKRRSVADKLADIFKKTMLANLPSSGSSGLKSLLACEALFCLTDLEADKHLLESTRMEIKTEVSDIDKPEAEEEEELRKDVRVAVDILLSDNPTACTDMSRFVRRGLKYHYSHPTVLTALARAVRLKVSDEPSVRQIFEMVLGHSQFRTLMLTSPESRQSSAKEALVDLLIALVEAEPCCCNVNHVVILLAAYGGTLSISDQALLRLMSLYDRRGVSLNRFKPLVWGNETLSFYNVSEQLSSIRWKSPTISTVISLLDDAKIYRSAVGFPVRRVWPMEDSADFVGMAGERAEDYDPCFLLPLFRDILDEYCTTGQLPLNVFFAKHCVTFAVASLAARSSDIRKLGRYIIGKFVDLALEGEKFKERDLLLCILEHLRNSFPRPKTRLSSVHTNFYVRCISLLSKPEHRMFGVVWQFLLAKPQLNIFVVPEFVRLLYSSHIEHRIDRQWLLSLLYESLKEPRDFLVMERSRVFKHVMVLCQCPGLENSIQLLGLRLVEKAVQLASAAFSLLLHHNLLTWTQACLLATSNTNQRSILIRILDAVGCHLNVVKDSECVIVLRKELEALRATLC